MAQASVGVPAVLVAPVRESVVLLHQSTVEALHFALRAEPPRGEASGERPPEDVRRQRERLVRLDALLVQLGWWSEGEPPASGGVLELRAPGDVLLDVLHGALIDAGERLAGACGESWRGHAGLERIRAAAVEVIALDRLLGSIRE
jgi:hypothetical protein